MLRTPPPRELMIPIFEGLKSWNKKYSAAKKIEESFSFARMEGGGAILNVKSPEELDGIMAEFPPGPWAEIKVYALVDLDKAADNVIRVVGGMGG